MHPQPFHLYFQGQLSPPELIQVSSVSASINSITINFPSSRQPGDLMLAFIETSNEDIPDNFRTTLRPWKRVPNLPLGSGTPGSIGAVRLTVLYRWVYSSDETVTSLATGDSGDHQIGFIALIRGVDPRTAIDDCQASSAGTGLAFTFPAVTPSVESSMIVLPVAHDLDNATGNRFNNSITNANLYDVEKIADNFTSSGAGGGLGVWVAKTGTVGSIGTTDGVTTVNGVMFSAALALPPTPGEVPWLVGWGTETTNNASGNVSPSIPTEAVAGDYMLLLVETNNQAVSAPSGWVELASSPQGAGTGGTGTSARITAFYKYHSGSESAPTVVNPATYVAAVILAIRDVDQGQAVNVQAGSNASSTTSVSMPSVTTTVDNCLVLNIHAVGAAGNVYSAGNMPANADLDDVITLQRMFIGASGELNITYGHKSSAGSVTNTTAAVSSSTQHGYITIAIQPQQPLGGSAAQTLPSLGQVVTASLLPEGAAAQTLPSLAQSAASTERLTGQVAQTLGSVAQGVIAAQTVATGDTAQTLPSLQQAVAAAETLIAAVAQVTPKVAQTAAAKEILAATVAQTLPSAAQDAAATETLTGTVTQSLPEVAQAATAKEINTGVVAQTLAAVQQDVDTDHTDNAIDGAVVQALPAIGQIAAATETMTSDVAQVFPGVTQAAAVTERLGASVVQLLPVVLQGAAAKQSVAVTAAQTIPPVGQAVTADQVNTGVVAQQMPGIEQVVQSEIIYAGVGVSVTQVLPFVTQDAEAIMDASMVVDDAAPDPNYFFISIGTLMN